MGELIRQAVVLAGGMGTRLGEASRTVPKPMQDIGGVPFLEMVLRQLQINGIRRVTIAVGHLADRIVSHFGTGQGFGLAIDYFVEQRPLGTGGALGEIGARLDETFAVVNGDTLFDVPLQLLRPGAFGDGVEACIALRHVDDAGRYGAIELEGSRIVRFAEKGGEGRGLVNGGVYVLRRCVALSINGPTSLEHDVFPRLVERGAAVGLPDSGYFIDIGVPEDLSRARRELPARLRRPVALLDRDGVVNVDHGHVHRIEDFDWVPGVVDAIRLLNARGYRVAVVTNQAGLAKGYYSAAQFERLTAWMINELLVQGAIVHAVYHCPHHPEGVIPELSTDCDCRKPRPGMVRAALLDLMAEPERSFMIGDKTLDVAAANAAGIKGHIFDGTGTLLACVERILSGVTEDQVAGATSPSLGRPL